MNKKKRIGFWGWVGIIFVGLIVLGIISNTTKEKPDDLSIYSMAQTYVERYLKSPSTANFPTLSNVDIAVDKKKGLYRVKSYVDAQNSFSARIRSSFMVLMEYNPTDESWSLIDIQIH